MTRSPPFSSRVGKIPEGTYFMALLFRSTLIAALALAALPAGKTGAGAAEDEERNPCTEDAMLVFDASGSMAGNLNQGISTIVPRIDEVRSALAEVLPAITRFRRVGLITYGPGPYQQCNVELAFKPTPDAAGLIMQKVNTLNPVGKTPLTAAVEQAAEVLDYQEKPGLIVVLTDGEETCGGSPCDLGKQLRAGAMQLTVHVIGFRMKNFSWTGEQSILDVKCLAEQNGGLYINAEAKQDLIDALEKTLGCPMLSQRIER
jgi:Ca-activated chloride channel family protein